LGDRPLHDGERGDHDDHPGSEERAEQDGGGDPPAGHAQHAGEAAARERGEHPPVADLTAHLDGAHRVAAHPCREHLGEEQALQV